MELLGQAKSMRLIKFHKFNELTVFIHHDSVQKENLELSVRQTYWPVHFVSWFLTPTGAIASLLLKFWGGE
jgi:hypothetical protein